MIRSLALALLLLAACSKPEGSAARSPKGPLAFPVEVEEVASRDVEYTLSAVGSVEAFERVQVTARVAGVVDRVRFSEGQSVKEGTVLAEIEPTRFSLAVRSAKAAVEKAAAAKAEADAGLKRRESVDEKSPGLIRGEELETWRTRALAAAAELQSAEVALAQAELNVRDAYVRAPVSGVLQTRTVQTGQYVQPGTVLATLLRREPLLLRFKVPEPDAPRLRVGMVARFALRGEARPYSSRITHVADAADEGSRMVAVTAEVDDPEKDKLRPGAFAEVTVPVGKSGGSPVVPQTSVRPSERGFLAFVVEDGLAKERVLELGLRTPDGKVEVRGGLSVGESLVVRGAEALRDGVKVSVSGQAAPEARERAVPGGRP
ncbi:MAG: efflux RND transporter periplasmic adaptor subunit [Myxococcales bacterium]|nr:efflux RND transporter periplasmic adaptor subunit [Myxococcales bacterium]